MDEHILDSEKAAQLEDKTRCRIVSQEELLGAIDDGDTVVDIGSGTGFFTDDMATRARKVYAVDFQEGMHEFYREKGVPENVELVHSRASEIEIEQADVIFSILSLHEIDLEKALETFQEVLEPGGKLFVIDWSQNAATDDIPPREKLYSAESAAEVVSEFFDVLEAEERYNTFKLVAKPGPR
ncbi:class I SAM-dependent methyltransferase [Halodesulfurarchaeum sp. HSR-GB]|uniref:class I SAM-dependent methyltransferase n=1 Tax=Halodesulfurarchaeum sp. HSR-GB TaxID=3074077 RepID=UPI0028608EFB|nr:class I SAM-dependent methyltransferase [Halodesulfurarchaeum sp. HSR-GB]MDR5657121.1 class I SAM-dependent methyltransferase [Halodesulfurarchaeum sp. HSR-GB]